MNSSVWNIKEMFSIPTGTGANKTSSRSSAPSDYSSLTDSQFLFGSQFCPEYSQSASQEVNFPSRVPQSSQQNSQEQSEPRFSTKYQTKPYLFGGDNKEKSKGPHFGCGNTKGILEQFEVNKKKAKEKEESEFLYSGFSQLRECMEGIKLSINSIENNTDSLKRCIMEGLDLFMKTLQENMGSHYESILSALSSQSQALQEIEKRETIINSETIALSSFVLGLQESLESMKSQQSEGYENICEKLSWLSDNLQFNEILSLLNKLSAACKPIYQLKDSTVQTSPGLYEKRCLVRQEKTYFETTRVCRTSSIQTQGALAAGQGGDGESSIENRPVDNISQQCYGRGSQVPMAKTKHSPVRYAEPPKQQICRENCKDNSLESSLLYRVPYQTRSASTTATFPRIPVSVSSNQNVQPALKEQQSDQQATSNGMNVFKAQTAMNTLEQKKDLYDFETQTKINQGFKSKDKHTAIDNSPGFERINKKAIGPKKACKRQPAFQNRRNACTSKKKRKVNILKFSQSQSKKQIQALEEHEDCGADTQKSRGIFENKVGGVSIPAKNQRYQNSELKEKLIPMCYIRKSVVKTTEDAGRCILESTNASKVMNNLWDSSSQESGHTQGIAGFEKQALSWISPVMHRPPCPAVNATKTQDMQKSKMRSRICMFDTSDDSD